MSQEKIEQKQRLIRLGVLLAVLLLAVYGFFDLTKRLDEAKKQQAAAAANASTSTSEAEITD